MKLFANIYPAFIIVIVIIVMMMTVAGGYVDRRVLLYDSVDRSFRLHVDCVNAPALYRRCRKIEQFNYTLLHHPTKGKL